MGGWNQQTWMAMLLGAALKSTVVVVAAWLVAFALRRRSAAARHLVWTAAAAALLALPLLTLSLPALPVRAGALTPLVSAVTFRADAWATPSASAPFHPQTARRQTPVAPAASRNAFRLSVALLWAAGSAVVLLHMLAAWVVMWRLRRRACPLAGAPPFRELARALGIRRAVELLEIAPGAMPLSFGILRPAVFLPADARHWSEGRRRVVMLHELAHIRRGDLATQMLVRTSVALFWWNPLAWTAWREFVKERERAADDLVLTAGEPAAEYAGHLLDIARSMQQVPTLVSAAVAMARPSQLEGRLVAILDARTNRHSPGPRSALAAAALAVALMAPFAALQAQDKTDPAIQPAVDAAIQAAIGRQVHDITDAAAAAYIGSARYDAAQQLLETSLRIRANTSGDHSSEYAAGLMKLGDLAVKRGKTPDAVDFYTRAVALGDTPETAPALVYLASHALSNQDPIAAGHFIDRALAAAPPAPTAASAFRVRGDIAASYGLAGVAEVDYLQALAQNEPNSPGAALTLETYARFLDSQSRGEEAEALRHQAIAIRQAHVAAISHQSRGWTDPAGAATPLRVGHGVSAPQLLYKAEPEYSEEARAAKYQGMAVLQVVIGLDGQAANLQLLKSIGFGLDEKAAEAILKWRFKPGQKDTLAVPVEAVIEVNFRLL